MISVDLFDAPVLFPPTAYQGGKARLAKQILDIIKPSLDRDFYDLCCGSGAVTLELINRGFPKDRIIMVDKGPYGEFWQMVCSASFDLDVFDRFLDGIPKDPSQISAHLSWLASQEILESDRPYIFLLLQAGAFGGKSIGIKNGKWLNKTFRSYWLPKPGCNRTSHVNPMMPMPGSLRQRVRDICSNFAGVRAYHDDVKVIHPARDAVVYIDPPYANTYGYNQVDLDVVAFVKTLSCQCYVSEAVPLCENAICLSTGRAKGGITSARKKANSEFLSQFHIGTE